MNSEEIQPYIYTHPFSPKLPSHPGCHITLSRVPSWHSLWIFSLKSTLRSIFKDRKLDQQKEPIFKEYDYFYYCYNYKFKEIWLFLLLILLLILLLLTIINTNNNHMANCHLMKSSVSSVGQSCPTLCDPKDCSTPGLPVCHQLLEFIQTHVLWVSDAIQSSHPLSSPSPPGFNSSEHQGLFKWVSSLHQVAKVLEFQLQHQFFHWVFRTDFL